jgi:hypothetical protein
LKLKQVAKYLRQEVYRSFQADACALREFSQMMLSARGISHARSACPIPKKFWKGKWKRKEEKVGSFAHRLEAPSRG